MSGGGFRWDLPIRLFHWTLVSAVAVALLSGWQGGAWMSLHAAAGYLILALLGFRLVWGFIGPAPARWATLLRRLADLRPQAAAAQTDLQAGHKPSGVLSVLFLLGLLAAQALAGLVSNDEIGFAGPLAAWIDEETSLRLTAWHRLSSDLIWLWILVHLSAIAYYRVIKRHALLPRMRLSWRAACAVGLGLSLAFVWAARDGWSTRQRPAETQAPATAASSVGGW